MASISRLVLGAANAQHESINKRFAAQAKQAAAARAAATASTSAPPAAPVPPKAPAVQVVVTGGDEHTHAITGKPPSAVPPNAPTAIAPSPAMAVAVRKKGPATGKKRKTAHKGKAAPGIDV